jgi:hypothetical protein
VNKEHEIDHKKKFEEFKARKNAATKGKTE